MGEALGYLKSMAPQDTCALPQLGYSLSKKEVSNMSLTPLCLSFPSSEP